MFCRMVHVLSSIVFKGSMNVYLSTTFSVGDLAAAITHFSSEMDAKYSGSPSVRTTVVLAIAHWVGWACTLTVVPTSCVKTSMSKKFRLCSEVLLT